MLGSLVKRVAKSLLGTYIANKFRFYFCHGYWGDFTKPLTYSEWINYVKLNYTDEMIELSDKLGAKKWLVSNGYSDYVVRDYFEGKVISKEEYDCLPNSFVLKLNSGAGAVLVVKDKSKTKYHDILKIVRGWCEEDYSIVGYEFHYEKIEKKVFAEELISFDEKTGPIDYKFHCFPNGRIFVAVYSGRGSVLTTDYFDEQWSPVELEWVDRSKAPDFILKRPSKFDEALELVKKIYSELEAKYVRIDLYLVKDRIVFGEFTFTPAAGLMKFKSKEADMNFGGNLEG